MFVNESLLVSRAGPFQDVSTGGYVIIRGRLADSTTKGRSEIKVFVNIIVAEVHRDVLVGRLGAPNFHGGFNSIANNLGFG